MNPIMVMTQDEHERMATLGLTAASYNGLLGYASVVCPGALLFYERRFLRADSTCDGEPFNARLVSAPQIQLVDIEIVDED